MSNTLTIRWNKDMSISIYSRGKVVHKFCGVFAKADTENFLDGWFNGVERKVRWIIA